MVWERSPHAIIFSSFRSALRSSVSPSITRAQGGDAHSLDGDGHVGTIWISSSFGLIELEHHKSSTEIWSASINPSSTMESFYEEALENKLFSSLFDFIEDTNSIDDIIEKTASEPSLSWNLQNFKNKCGTIEFRRPPQTQNSHQCKYWIALTLTIIFWALAVDFSEKTLSENSKKIETILQDFAESIDIFADLNIPSSDKNHDDSWEERLFWIPPYSPAAWVRKIIWKTDVISSDRVDWERLIGTRAPRSIISG